MTMMIIMVICVSVCNIVSAGFCVLGAVCVCVKEIKPSEWNVYAVHHTKPKAHTHKNRCKYKR